MTTEELLAMTPAQRTALKPVVVRTPRTAPASSEAPICAMLRGGQLTAEQWERMVP